MDCQNARSQQQIKIEVFKTEDDTNYFYEDQDQTCTKQEITEENVLDSPILKYERDICDETLVNEYHQDYCKEEPDQSVQNTEPEEKVRIYKCEHHNCGMTFKRYQRLIEHISIHSDEKPFKCEYTGCTKTFRRKKDLYGHKRVHSEEKPFKCVAEGCGKAFKAKYNLITHLTLHSNEKPFKCTHEGCGKSFKGKNNLRAHLPLHSNEKPFKCSFEGCNKAFKVKNHLRAHLPLHNSDSPFKCTYEGCGKAFKRKYDLTTHQTNHVIISDDMEVVECEHPDCKATFPVKNSNYYKHMRRHKIARYHCTFEECDAEFHESFDYERHISKHMGKTFFCGYEGCDKSYSRRDKLLSHQKKHGVGSYNSSKTTEIHDVNPSNLQSTQGEVELTVKIEKSPVQDLGECDNLTNVRLCSICEETFSEENEFHEHAKCCKKYSLFEFVGVDQVETEDDTVNIKSECEDMGL